MPALHVHVTDAFWLSLLVGHAKHDAALAPLYVLVGQSATRDARTRGHPVGERRWRVLPLAGRAPDRRS